MAKSIKPSTQSIDKIWLIKISHSCETINGTRLPCDQDIIKNFVNYHLKMKLTLS